MTEQIPRGADLTDEDIEVLADDVMVVVSWCTRNSVKSVEWRHQLKEAMRARLGRRPLIFPEKER